MRLERDDLATVLAALRYYQEKGQGDPANRSDAIHEIATDGDEVISLDADAIDDLCERINCADDEADALLRRLSDLFPEVGTEDELNGGDAVERLGYIIPDVRAYLAGEDARQEPITLILNIEGGNLDGIASNRPAWFAKVRVVKQDWDTDGCDPEADDVHLFPDDTGRKHYAYVGEMSVDQADPESVAFIQKALSDSEKRQPEFIAREHGWDHGGDNGGIWFHSKTWGGSWKAAQSWSGTDNEPAGKPAIYDTLEELLAGEEIEVPK